MRKVGFLPISSWCKADFLDENEARQYRSQVYAELFLMLVFEQSASDKHPPIQLWKEIHMLYTHYPLLSQCVQNVHSNFKVLYVTASAVFKATKSDSNKTDCKAMQHKGLNQNEKGEWPDVRISY